MTRSFCFFVLICLIGFAGCASQSVMLVHPQSGATVRCGAAGAGLMAGFADGFVEECLRSYGGKGYVSVEKLTPEQRADLERRGLLPKAEPPPLPMGY